jgi:hypothetical protein
VYGIQLDPDGQASEEQQRVDLRCMSRGIEVTFFLGQSEGLAFEAMNYSRSARESVLDITDDRLQTTCCGYFF